MSEYIKHTRPDGSYFYAQVLKEGKAPSELAPASGSEGQPTGPTFESEIDNANPGTSSTAKLQIVDLWLRGEKNEARLILEAFKIGLDEGRRAPQNSD